MAHDRRERLLYDEPFGHRRVRVRRRKRVWRCREPACPVVTFTETQELAAPRALLTRGAVISAANALADDDTTMNALARRLDVAWQTVWDALEVEARRRAEDPQPAWLACSRSASTSTSGGPASSGRAARYLHGRSP